MSGGEKKRVGKRGMKEKRSRTNQGGKIAAQKKRDLTLSAAKERLAEESTSEAESSVIICGLLMEGKGELYLRQRITRGNVERRLGRSAMFSVWQECSL